MAASVLPALAAVILASEPFQANCISGVAEEVEGTCRAGGLGIGRATAFLAIAAQVSTRITELKRMPNWVVCNFSSGTDRLVGIEIERLRPVDDVRKKAWTMFNGYDRLASSRYQENDPL